MSLLNAVRLRAPRSIRTVYRAVRALKPVPSSQGLPDDLVRGCQCVSHRTTLLSELPSRGRVAELGTYKGDFAEQILIRCDPQELHLIDIDLSRLNQRIAFDRRIKCHRGRAHEIIGTFDDSYFDWVYIDADHSYNAALRDGIASAPKVKPGGYLVFNDFAHLDTQYGRYGVHRAVCDFAVENRWPLAFLAFNPDGLYDVALRKPQ